MKVFCQAVFRQLLIVILGSCSFGAAEDLESVSGPVAPLSGPVAPHSVSVSDGALEGSDYGLWRDFILPAPDELVWRQIPWLVTFKDGVSAANEARKPLLFWAMNGHPLACT